MPLTTSLILREVRALWLLAWPILVGQLATIGMSVTDVTMAGHASAQDLAGVSLGVSIWNMIILTVMGLLLSVSPLVAHHMGAEEHAQVAPLVRQALWKALLVGLLACLIANLSAWVFDAMDLEARVHTVATQFVHITSGALPAFAVYRVLYGYSTSISQTKPMMVVALLACALNALLNWVLVFGHFGLPALGGVGCAWATLLCIWFQLLALLWWMHRSPAYRSTWPLDRFEAPHGATLRQLFRLGVPIGITYFAETSAFSLIALLIAKFGSAQVAAHAIALNFTSFTFMVPLSLGLALLTRVGQSLGAGDAQGARFRAWTGIGMTLVIATASALLMFLGRAQIAQAYTNDPQVAALAAQLLVLAALFQFSDCTQVVTSCAIRGYKVTRAPMLLHLTAFWGFSLPLGYLWGRAPSWLPFAPATPMAAQGFWLGLNVGLTIAAIGLVLMLRKVARRHMLRA
jgi:MATE family multidrug resistance protein